MPERERDSDGFRPPPPVAVPAAGTPGATALGPPPSPMSVNRRSSSFTGIRTSGVLEAAMRASDQSGVAHLGPAGVVHTNDDATAHKARAVALGYWKDPYTALFVRRGDVEGRGCPLINRGYFARVRFMNNAIGAFFKAAGDRDCQILNLGCGYDTAYWRLALHDALPTNLRAWIEVDFPEVVSVKQGVIDSSPEMTKVCGDGRYKAVTVDLRDTQAMTKVLMGDAGTGGLLNPDAPTLIMSECVLIYLRPEESDAVVSWCTSQLKNCCFATYEQVNPDSNFGRRMVSNLEQRGCPLLGIEKYPTLDSQKQRYLTAGFGHAEALTMNAVWERVPFTERRRVDRIEMLDEIEEWQLIHNHYCFVCSSKAADPQDPLCGWVEEVFKRPPPPTLPDGRPLALPPHTPAGGVFVD